MHPARALPVSYRTLLCAGISALAIAATSQGAQAQYSAGGGNATGPASVAIGPSATATQLDDIAIGNVANATGPALSGAVAVGSGANVTAYQAIGIGINPQVTGSEAIAVGTAASGSGNNAIAVGFFGVVIATRPGTSAFQPIVFVAIAGVVCNAGYGLTTRRLAGHDSAETTLVWTPLAGVIATTPLLPWFWVTPQSPRVWAVMLLMGASGAFGHWLMILAHQRAPASAMAPFGYTQLLWMIIIGWLVFGDTPPGATLLGAGIVIACGVFLAWRERRGAR